MIGSKCRLPRLPKVTLRTYVCLWKVTVYEATLEIAETPGVTVKALIKAAKKPAKADAPITPHYETDEPWGRFGWVDEDVKWFKIVKD